MEDNKYLVGDADLSTVRNRNEQRVIKAIRKVLVEPPLYTPDNKDLMDIYALALNALHPRYVQQGTIVLRDPVRDDTIMEAVRDAFIRVMERPKG